MNRSLIIVIILVLAASIWFGALSPQLKKVALLRTELAEKEELLFIRREYVERLRRASDKISERGNDIDKAEVALKPSFVQLLCPPESSPALWAAFPLQRTYAQCGKGRFL